MLKQLNDMESILNKNRDINYNTEYTISCELQKLRESKENIDPKLNWEFMAFDFEESNRCLNFEKKYPYYYVTKYTGVTENNQKIPLSSSIEDISSA